MRWIAQLNTATVVIGVLAAFSAGAAEKSDFEVTLLGTGTPPPLMHKFGPATLVQVNGRTFLFDAGRGATQRLWQKRVRFGQGLDAVFLTHLHSDHVVGLPDIFLTGWLGGPFGRRKAPMILIGPKGSKNLGDGLMQAYSWDIQTRIADQKLAADGAKIITTEVTSDGTVFDKDGVQVTAFKVDHGGGVIDPVYGYRVDFDGRSMVISGDTITNDNLIKHASGVDLLIHSVGAARQELLDTSPLWKRIMGHHITPEEVGAVFNKAKPKLAAFSHIVAATNGKIKPVPPGEMVKRTKSVYAGPLVMGKDLMAFSITTDGVKVHQPMGK
jgi:ribonuclease Z